MSNYGNPNEEPSSTDKWTDVALTWPRKWIAMPLLVLSGFGLIGMMVMYGGINLVFLGSGVFMIGLGAFVFFAPQYTTVVDPLEKTITVTSSRGNVKIIHFSDIVGTGLISSGKYGIIGIRLDLANGKQVGIFQQSGKNIYKSLKRLDLILANSK